MKWTLIFLSFGQLLIAAWNASMQSWSMQKAGQMAYSIKNVWTNSICEMEEETSPLRIRLDFCWKVFFCGCMIQSRWMGGQSSLSISYFEKLQHAMYHKSVLEHDQSRLLLYRHSPKLFIFFRFTNLRMMHKVIDHIIQKCFAISTENTSSSTYTTRRTNDACFFQLYAVRSKKDCCQPKPEQNWWR